MKRKIVCISTAIVLLIILGSLSPSVCSKDIETVTVEVNRFYGKSPQTIKTEMTISEANDLQQILTELNIAIENSDEATIARCESILNEKGIFGDSYQKFFSNNKYTETMEKTNLAKYTKYFEGKSADNISNKFCYFNARGEGLMLWGFGLKFFQAIISAIQNVSNPIGAVILLIAMLPFLVLTLLLTDLIPFRILAPSGTISIQNGTVSSLGLQGFKRQVVGPEAIGINLSWFTGLTINIPRSSGTFLFVSGIAVEVKQAV